MSCSIPNPRIQPKATLRDPSVPVHPPRLCMPTDLELKGRPSPTAPTWDWSTSSQCLSPLHALAGHPGRDKASPGQTPAFQLCAIWHPSPGAGFLSQSLSFSQQRVTSGDRHVFCLTPHGEAKPPMPGLHPSCHWPLGRLRSTPCVWGARVPNADRRCVQIPDPRGADPAQQLRPARTEFSLPVKFPPPF